MASSATTPCFHEDPTHDVGEGSTVDPIPDYESSRYDGKSNFNHELAFALSLEELENYSLPHSGSNYHKVSTAASKAKIEALIYQKDTLDTLILAIQNSTDPLIQAKIQPMKSRLAHLNDCITKEETKLKEITQLSSQFREKLEVPKSGTKESVDIEKARLSIPIFNKVDESVSFKEFWHKFSCYSEYEQLTEKAMKTLLQFLLQGEPFDTFYDCQNKTLDQILPILVDRYGPICTLNDKIKSLDTLSRDSNEKLGSTMRKVANLIDSTKLLVREKDRDFRFEILMTNNLIKLASPKARKEILAFRHSAARSGYTVSYKELLTIAQDVERLEHEPSSSEALYGFPVLRTNKFRSHGEKPYDASKGFRSRTPPPAPSHSFPKVNSSVPSHSPPFHEGRSDYHNNNNQRMDRPPNYRNEYVPRYNNYHDSADRKFQQQYDDRPQWYNNHNNNRPNYNSGYNQGNYGRNYKPKIYQAYGNYSRHSHPPFPMECGFCKLYHFGRCSNNHYQQRNYKNNLN